MTQTQHSAKQNNIPFVQCGTEDDVLSDAARKEPALTAETSHLCVNFLTFWSTLVVRSDNRPAARVSLQLLLKLHHILLKEKRETEWPFIVWNAQNSPILVKYEKCND